jgi:hypothetical protein
MKNLINRIIAALDEESTYENAALLVLTFACIMLIITTVTNGTAY